MDMMMDEKLLLDCAAEIGAALTEEMAAQFAAYTRLLLEWNEKMNLTAITDPREIVLKHYADSLTALAVLDRNTPLRVADVGTGAGFPGLPLKIAAPQWDVTLMDALQKRVGFLQCVTEALRLDHVTCIHTRAEDAGRKPSHRGAYDAVVSRAVARLGVLAEYALPFVKIGGTFVALKGPSAEEEVKEAKAAIQRLGGELEAIREAVIPFTELKHTLVVVKKVRQTPTIYPRAAAQISKSAIK